MTETSGQERLTLLSQIEADINSGAISLGEAIRRIRTELYGMTQTQYAAYTKVSDKTLREIEKRPYRRPLVQSKQVACTR
ncbi:hypothetical protein [Rheinheimera sp.]|uniref:hypothetical protein n=1 Tax=Rheinheimera sp. TaxID=1869214 RepID=UPI004047B687